MKNGKYISFWCDCWLGDTPICSQYPILYDLCIHKGISVYEVARQRWVIQIRITLPPMIRNLWDDLVIKWNNVHLVESKDEVKWSLTSNGKFSVRSLYDYMTKNDSGPSYKYIWKFAAGSPESNSY